MTDNKYEEQYRSENEQEYEVHFRTVDDILAYYGRRHGSNTDKTEDTLNS
ncbi:hypothetical protein [Paenibacillus faecalis]|nr:hypothetical protein [Paenibacillus faecalis]